MGPRAIDYVLGIVKAYTTRVGEGPFPTELDDEVGKRLGERGHEFGTVTGRKRRCGWFDAGAGAPDAARSNGIDGIALTKLDVLDGFEELKICVGYKLDGARLDHLPTAAARRRGEPVYETMEGWSETTAGRALVERAAGAGGQVRAAHRGADRRPVAHAVDEPRARRHHPRHRPLHHVRHPA